VRNNLPKKPTLPGSLRSDISATEVRDLASAASIHDGLVDGGGRPRRMRQSLRRSAFESVMTGVTGQGFLVVSGVLGARMLSVHDRGVLALVTVIPSLLVNLGTLGVPRAVTFEAARPGGSAGLALRAAVPLAIVQTIGILVVGVIVALLVSAGQPAVRGVAFLALAAAPFGVIQIYGLAALQGLGSFRVFNILRLAGSVGYAVFVAALFILGPTTAPVVVAGWVVVSAIPCLPLFLRVRQELGAERTHAAAEGLAPSRGELVRFGVRSLVGSLSPLGSMNADQILVGVILSPAALGLYAVASSVCNLPRFVAQSLGLVAYPHVAGLTGRRQARALVRLALTTGIVTGLTVVALELTVGIIIPLFFGQRYAESVPVVRVLLLSAFLFGISRVLSDSLQGAGRPLDGTIAEAVAWVTLALALAAFWGALDDVRFAAAMALAAGASLSTIALLAFLRVIMPSRAAETVEVGHATSP
jgi:O-antigen/teichoic acid export membrane protein